MIDLKSDNLHRVFRDLSLPFQSDNKDKVIDYNWHVD